MMPPSLLPTLPEEYFMCSKAECQERQSSGEVSIFESMWPPPSLDDNTHAPTSNVFTSPKKPGTRRVANPRWAMTKYRRSAAGVDTRNRTPPRSLEQLETCMSVLEYILCYQQQPPVSASSAQAQTNPFPKQTLAGTVSFVEDRIRAMQVDLVVSQQNSSKLQHRMVRLHILILYLLGRVPTYESKFGLQALMTAFTNYWSSSNNNSIRKTDQDDDEILCWFALHQLCQYIRVNYRQGNNDAATSAAAVTEPLSNILDYYRRALDTQQQRLAHFPKFEWALKLVDLAVMGRPQSILRKLAGRSSINNSSGGTDNANTPTSSFDILCRCCLAPVVDILRIQALDQYNKTYMKGEKVMSQEIARLLFFETAEQARLFTHQTAGLKLHDDGDKIIFKVGPIQRLNEKDIGKRQDVFVFGASLYNWPTLEHSHVPTPTAAAAARTAWDDYLPDQQSNASNKDSGVALSNVEVKDEYAGARIDAEGVLVPPPELLQRILLSIKKLA